MELDFQRLHRVALGEQKERGCGLTTLFLVQVIHQIWHFGENVLILPVDRLEYGEWLLRQLKVVCDAMRVPYNRTGVLSAVVDGTEVRTIAVRHEGRDLMGWRCSIMAEGEPYCEGPCPTLDHSLFEPQTFAPYFV